MFRIPCPVLHSTKVWACRRISGGSQRLSGFELPLTPAIDMVSVMADPTLATFIQGNLEAILLRCHDKGHVRQGQFHPRPTAGAGLSTFLEQLVHELGTAQSMTREVLEGATRHGGSLYTSGFTVSEVVHEYGDVCQAVTDLAVERSVEVSAEDFRTMNRCLDDAIAAAVSEYSRRQRVHNEGKAMVVSNQLYNMIHTAIAGFEALRTGSVGVGGATGDLVYRTLVALRDRVSSA